MNEEFIQLDEVLVTVQNKKYSTAQNAVNKKSLSAHLWQRHTGEIYVPWVPTRTCHPSHDPNDQVKHFEVERDVVEKRSVDVYAKTAGFTKTFNIDLGGKCPRFLSPIRGARLEPQELCGRHSLSNPNMQWSCSGST